MLSGREPPRSKVRPFRLQLPDALPPQKVLGAGSAPALAKACRKNYTLQNPDFCGSLIFRGFGG
jgi:hypothetical protein